MQGCKATRHEVLLGVLIGVVGLFQALVTCRGWAVSRHRGECSDDSLKGEEVREYQARVCVIDRSRANVLIHAILLQATRPGVECNEAG